MRIICVLLILLSVPGFAAQLLGTSCHMDSQHPEFAAFWNDSTQVDWGEKPIERSPGCSTHVFIRNDSPKPLQIDDVTLNGINLRKAVAFSTQRKMRKSVYPASVYFSDQDKNALIAAGEPVWWRVEPNSIPPGGVSEVTIRLRKSPIGKTLTVGVGDLEVSVPVKVNQPLIESISFGADAVYLYLPKSPVKVMTDGREIAFTAGHDSRITITPVTCKLAEPLTRASFHVLQAVFADGSKASAGLRAWSD